MQQTSIASSPTQNTFVSIEPKDVVSYVYYSHFTTVQYVCILLYCSEIERQL
jgi:hypothetical protein